MNKYVYLGLVLVVAFAGAYVALRMDHNGPAGLLGGTDARVIVSAATNGEVLVATTGTAVVARDSARQYLRICKTNTQNSQSQITFSVNASPSHGRGFILDSRAPCVEFSDPVVTGALWALASPSAASVSFATF